MDEKNIPLLVEYKQELELPALEPNATARYKPARFKILKVITVALAFLTFVGLGIKSYLNNPHRVRVLSYCPTTAVDTVESKEQVVRKYALTIGQRWLNPDGGVWRNIFVCNGESPCPTLNAVEGDVVEINVRNDGFAVFSLHWSGMAHHRFGFWNDGTGGLNQYPIFPRGNFTTKYDTTGHWGLNWYADHSSTGIIDGAHGVAWIAPAPSRPRPYDLIVSSKADLQLIREAEADVQHMLVWNYYRKDVGWRIMEFRSEGTGFHCYDSLLVNSKGRRHCRHPDYPTLNGQQLDETGCAVLPPQEEGIPCTPTDSDYEIIYTHGKPYIMLNILNIGFEHAIRVSIDDHKMWVIANDGGFVEPQLVDVLYISNGVRYTVLVKLDQEPWDYAIRMASTSNVNMLQGYSILRYPALRYPMHGAPMSISPPLSGNAPCLNPDASVHHSCNTTSPESFVPWPRKEHEVPDSNRTVKFVAGQRKSAYEEGLVEYYLNEQPWQLWRYLKTPILFADNITATPQAVGDLPYGTVVDLIVQNNIDDVMPLYKHGALMYLLGTHANQEWIWDDVEDALSKGVKLNMETPSLSLVHDVPPLGWAVIRFKVSVYGVTMMHSNKFKYYALGMAAPLLEGMSAPNSMKDKVPDWVKEQPHVEFTPKNDGVLG